MANVMTRAWDIATEGQEKFGGSKVEYIAEALKQAWAESKKEPKQMELSQDLKYSLNEDNTKLILTGSKRQKSYVAEIKGSHPTYKLNREFVEGVLVNRVTEYEIEENKLYEMQEARKRYYLMVVDGLVYEYTYNQVLDLVK